MAVRAAAQIDGLAPARHLGDTAILAGDFNAVAVERGVRRIEAAGGLAAAPAGPTWLDSSCRWRRAR